MFCLFLHMVVWKIWSEIEVTNDLEHGEHTYIQKEEKHFGVILPVIRVQREIQVAMMQSLGHNGQHPKINKR